jgi:hypothetical protein
LEHFFINCDLNVNENSRTEQEIESDLRNIVIDYMVPKVVILNTFPLLVNVKIDRQFLLKYYEKLLDSKPQFQFDYSGVPENKKEVAKELFEVIALITGNSEFSVDSNFYEIGGNSLNSVYVIMQLREKDCFISISDFIGASNLGEILQKIRNSGQENERELDYLEVMKDLKLTCHPVKEEHKDEIIEITCTGFYEKDAMCKLLKNEITAKDILDFVNAWWMEVFTNELCFIVKDSADTILGVSLNFDEDHQPDFEIFSKMIYIMTLIESLEKPIRFNFHSYNRSFIIFGSFIF